jgi:hypothetical protein
MVGGTFCVAAAAASVADASSDVLSVDDLSFEFLSLELLPADLPSLAFELADVSSLRWMPVAELESDGSSRLDCETPDESSERRDDVWLDDVWLEDAVSRDDRSVAEFLGGGK